MCPEEDKRDSVSTRSVLRIFCVQFLGSDLIAVYDFLIRQDREGGVNNDKFMGLNSLWAIYLRVQLNDPCESLPTWNIL